MWCCMSTENGLTLLLDAESYDYAFSPQTGEGFKLAVHSHMDQPIMALADIDLSPGFVTQLSVTPILRQILVSSTRTLQETKAWLRIVLMHALAHDFFFDF